MQLKSQIVAKPGIQNFLVCSNKLLWLSYLNRCKLIPLGPHILVHRLCVSFPKFKISFGTILVHPSYIFISCWIFRCNNFESGYWGNIGALNILVYQPRSSIQKKKKKKNFRSFSLPDCPVDHVVGFSVTRSAPSFVQLSLCIFNIIQGNSLALRKFIVSIQWLPALKPKTTGKNLFW